MTIRTYASPTGRCDIDAPPTCPSTRIRTKEIHKRRAS